ncbi:MAG: hypothetical protein ACRC0V_09385 [Fusobacteriaceae bacterium]
MNPVRAFAISDETKKKIDEIIEKSKIIGEALDLPANFKDVFVIEKAIDEKLLRVRETIKSLAIK